MLMRKYTVSSLIPFRECEASPESTVVLVCGFFPTARISGVTSFFFICLVPSREYIGRGMGAANFVSRFLTSIFGKHYKCSNETY